MQPTHKEQAFQKKELLVVEILTVTPVLMLGLREQSDTL
jgi:hypothetical protein